MRIAGTEELWQRAADELSREEVNALLQCGEALAGIRDADMAIGTFREMVTGSKVAAYVAMLTFMAGTLELEKRTK